MVDKAAHGVVRAIGHVLPWQNLEQERLSGTILLSLEQVYSADESFVTGTFGGWPATGDAPALLLYCFRPAGSQDSCVAAPCQSHLSGSHRFGPVALSQTTGPSLALAGGQTPVREVDGRMIGTGARGPVVARLQRLYAELCDAEAARGRDFLE